MKKELWGITETEDGKHIPILIDEYEEV